MNVILPGAAGMVGQGVLRKCLLDPEAESVLIIGRGATGQQHGKLHENVHNDVSDLSAIKGRLSGYDACSFCLGVSAVRDERGGVWAPDIRSHDFCGLDLSQAQPGHNP